MTIIITFSVAKRFIGYTVCRGNTHTSPAWFAIACIRCLCHSASGSNCVWWCTKRRMDWRLYISTNSASSPALKVALGHLLGATWWFSGVSGREQSSVNAHLSSRVRRHGTSYRAPSATLHPWTVSRRLWKHLCFYLISDWLYITFLLLHAPYLSIGLWFVVCTASLNRSSCYGALEIIVTLLLLLLL